MLVSCSGGVGGVDVDALLRVAVLADFEFAFDAGDGDAETDDAGKHVPTSSREIIEVKFREVDNDEQVLLVERVD